MTEYSTFEKHVLSNQNMIIKKLDILLKRTGKVDLNDNFNIVGQEEAAKVLAISKETLQKRIKEGDIMIKNIHYRKTNNRYKFSQSALLDIKGLI